MNYVIADRRSKSGAVITCRAKVNPAEHTGVLDLVQRGGNAGEAPHHPPAFRPKIRSTTCLRRTTHQGFAPPLRSRTSAPTGTRETEEW